MSDLKLQRAEIETISGKKVIMVYDKNEDILDIFFSEKKPATGIELTENILLRLDRITGQAVSLTILHFSILTEQTEYSPRSYPLKQLEELPENLRILAIHALTTMPVNQFLKLSYFQESPTKRVPLTYIEPRYFASVA